MIEIHSKYDYEKCWMEDLIKFFEKCGVDDEKTVFIISDTQIFKEQVLEDISSILNSGERPNLYPFEIKQELIKKVTDKFQSETEGFSNNQSFAFFQQKAKDNLHLVLTFSPIGETFRNRLRTFPSLINCTTIDWFLPWPKSALESVAKSLLTPHEDNKHQEDSRLLDGKISKISHIFVTMQQESNTLSSKYLAEYKKYFYVTPKTYLELIAYFRRSLAKNIIQNTSDIARYIKGLEKLESAKNEVEIKKAELEVLQP